MAAINANNTNLCSVFLAALLIAFLEFAIAVTAAANLLCSTCNCCSPVLQPEQHQSPTVNSGTLLPPNDAPSISAFPHNSILLSAPPMPKPLLSSSPPIKFYKIDYNSKPVLIAPRPPSQNLLHKDVNTKIMNALAHQQQQQPLKSPFPSRAILVPIPVAAVIVQHNTPPQQQQQQKMHADVINDRGGDKRCDCMTAQGENVARSVTTTATTDMPNNGCADDGAAANCKKCVEEGSREADEALEDVRDQTATATNCAVDDGANECQEQQQDEATTTMVERDEHQQEENDDGGGEGGGEEAATTTAAAGTGEDNGHEQQPECNHRCATKDDGKNAAKFQSEQQQQREENAAENCCPSCCYNNDVNNGNNDCAKGCSDMAAQQQKIPMEVFKNFVNKNMGMMEGGGGRKKLLEEEEVEAADGNAAANSNGDEDSFETLKDRLNEISSKMDLLKNLSMEMRISQQQRGGRRVFPLAMLDGNSRKQTGWRSGSSFVDGMNVPPPPMGGRNDAVGAAADMAQQFGGGHKFDGINKGMLGLIKGIIMPKPSPTQQQQQQRQQQKQFAPLLTPEEEEGADSVNSSWAAGFESRLQRHHNGEAVNGGHHQPRFNLLNAIEEFLRESQKGNGGGMHVAPASVDEANLLHAAANEPTTTTTTVKASGLQMIMIDDHQTTKTTTTSATPAGALPLLSSDTNKTNIPKKTVASLNGTTTTTTATPIALEEGGNNMSQPRWTTTTTTTSTTETPETQHRERERIAAAEHVVDLAQQPSSKKEDANETAAVAATSSSIVVDDANNSSLSSTNDAPMLSAAVPNSFEHHPMMIISNSNNIPASFQSSSFTPFPFFPSLRASTDSPSPISPNESATTSLGTPPPNDPSIAITPPPYIPNYEQQPLADVVEAMARNGGMMPSMDQHMEVMPGEEERHNGNNGETEKLMAGNNAAHSSLITKMDGNNGGKGNDTIDQQQEAADSPKQLSTRHIHGDGGSEIEAAEEEQISLRKLRTAMSQDQDVEEEKEEEKQHTAEKNNNYWEKTGWQDDVGDGIDDGTREVQQPEKFDEIPNFGMRTRLAHGVAAIGFSLMIWTLFLIDLLCILSHS